LIFIFFAGTTVFATPARKISRAFSQSEKLILNAAITRTANYLQRTVTPQIGSVGGDWTIFGLARSKKNVDDAFFEKYFENVENFLREQNGVLDERRFTEYSRVILALTAAGFDARDVAGFDLTIPLTDFEKTVRQGINGAIFALLALDGLGCEISQNEKIFSARKLFLEKILREQNSDGGWALAGEKSDADITGMALQALAKYRDDADANDAIERALKFLSDAQNKNGGFASGFANASVESSVQVLVALTELNVSLVDPRFVKNGNTILDNVLSFQNSDGSFRHGENGANENLLSAEIGFYGLVAAQRSIENKNSLYRMDDRRTR
ncbi:MAG: terpene cyclase/mutase family protein, partial [Defluviitaleaceae bacterium]|nr:terpene cyclase/mutase family protein [Defluviitaleaceae bacterium]